MELRDIFEKKVRIESNVISIESLFNNPDRVKETDYRPSYQRNYVWDDEKATYFIESILLGTEIPPLVYFIGENKTEIIDGRQRYETILRFLKSSFKLKKKGLQKLDNIGIAGKSFKDLNSISMHNLAELFWETKIRIIEFSFHSRDEITDEIEDRVKKEIFKRYNSGITPLRQTEIAKAVYLEDDLNTYFKSKIKGDKILANNISNVFHFDKPDIELTLKTIRELLVLHNIPIKYYTTKKQSVIHKFYENLYSDISNQEIDYVYNNFITKLNLLLKFRNAFTHANLAYNRLVSECLFWMFSILENEHIDLHSLTDKEINEFVISLQTDFKDNTNPFLSARSSFAKDLFERYELTTKYFAARYNLDFDLYLNNNDKFREQNKDVVADNSDIIQFEELRITKPEPSSIAIVDICRLMGRQRFLIRPPYQRNEVINKKKSSSIIESLLLGIKLPPIFIFKREDGISEVLDGQQRLLSILGYINEKYLNEKNEQVESAKFGFALNLKSGMLSNLHGRRFTQLSPMEQKRIKNFNLWTIEIDQKINKNFEPIDLFLRLNNKPYPIKDDTFEMWNSFINRDIVSAVKSAYINNKDWFYTRKASTRMENENFYASLAYFQYLYTASLKKGNYEHDGIAIYKIGNRINFRVKSKNDITKTLEAAENRDLLIDSINTVEFDFIKKIQELLIDTEDNKIGLNKKLDDLLIAEKGKRTQQSMYALWYFMFDIPMHVIKSDKQKIKDRIKLLFAKMANIESKEAFISAITEFKSDYKLPSPSNTTYSASLKNIVNIHNGIKENLVDDDIATDTALKYSGANTDIIITKSDIEEVFISDSNNVNRCSILIKKDSLTDDSLVVLFSDMPVAFDTGFVGVSNIRAGFQPSYIYSILSSSYVYAALNAAKISASSLNGIEIPIISRAMQNAFTNAFNYVRYSEPKSPERLFFKRLLDMMVYQVYFQSDFLAADLDIINSVTKELPQLSEESLKDVDIKDIYSRVTHSDNIIPALFIKILSLDRVMTYNDKHEKNN